jgi:hypothetical protein
MCDISTNKIRVLNVNEDDIEKLCANFNSTTLEEVIDPKKTVIDYALSEIDKIMNVWFSMYKNDFSGGKMRGTRGALIEDLVIKIVDKIAKELKMNISAKKGSLDKKLLEFTKSDGKKIKKDHQVDIHIYLDDRFVAVIECKAYLDSCYYTRACDDFNLFRKFNYNTKNLIFAFEDSIDEDTKIFIDFQNDNVCDEVFYILDGKRSSSKPVYDKKYKKEVNLNKLTKFIEYISNF